MSSLGPLGSGASSTPTTFQQRAMNYPVSVEGNITYNPYGYPPPAPVPPVPLSSLMAQQQPTFSTPFLNDMAKNLESACTRVGGKFSSHDYLHELGIDESFVLSHMPPNSQKLATFEGMMTDSTDKEYRALINVTQFGFSIIISHTKGAKPYPFSYIFIPYRFVVTYVRCKTQPQSVPDYQRPAPRVMPSQFPNPGNAIRIYTNDGRLHVLYQFQIDQFINSFDYLWRCAVGLAGRPVAPPVPIQTTAYVTPPAPQPVAPTTAYTPTPGVMAAAVYETNDGGLLFNDLQCEGRVLKPSPYPQMAFVPAAATVSRPPPPPQQHQQHIRKGGYEALPTGGDSDDDDMVVVPKNLPAVELSEIKPPKKPLN